MAEVVVHVIIFMQGAMACTPGVNNFF